MAAMIFSSLNERRREMAILRAVGARPPVIAALLVGEATVLALAGGLLGVVLMHGGLLIARPMVDAAFGLYLPPAWPGAREAAALAGVAAAGALTGLAPAWRAYRLSLADGMTVRI